MVFFIPWRVVAEESGAAHFGFGGAMLPDLLGPMVRPPAAPSPFLFSGLLFADSGSGRRWSSGGRGRPMMMLRRVGAAAMVTARRDLWGQLRHDPIATAG
jgi:hypothetical protein